jgi:putative hemolysin
MVGVGDIHAGPHLDEPRIVQRDDGSWLIDGLMPVVELHDLLAIEAFPGEEEGAFETLGGYLMSALDRIPQPSDHVEWADLRFEVVDMDGNRVDKVLVSHHVRTRLPIDN